MPYQDFRQFLDVLRRHGELIDTDRPVALGDIGKAMKQSYRRQGPGIVFNNNGTAFPLVAGVYATRPFGKPFSEVADVPGWEGYAVPELDDWR